MQRLAAEDVLHAQVRDYESLAAHPQAKHVGLLTPLAQFDPAAIPFARLPAQGAHRPLTAAPSIGQHTISALAEWGVARHDIDSLLEAGVLRQSPAIVEEV